jgi:heme/copper-type cytochrome/quinol oxidase subunit 3
VSATLEPVGRFPRTVAVAPPSAARTEGYSRGFWGVAVAIATEAMLFLALFAAYFFLRASSHTWPIGGLEKPKLDLRAWIFTAVLIGSSLPVFWADAAVKRGRTHIVRLGLLLSTLMGLAFLVNTVIDFRDLHYGWDTNAYGSIYYATVGLHAAHLVAGILLGLVVQVKVWRGLVDGEHHGSLEVFSLYWHFVDAVWIFVFSIVFVSPHIS